MRRHVSIDRNLYKQRACNIGEGSQEDAGSRYGCLQSVRPKIGKQATQKAGIVDFSNNIIVGPARLGFRVGILWQAACRFFGFFLFFAHAVVYRF